MLQHFRLFVSNYVYIQVRNMSIFIQKLNALTGTLEWHIQDEKYDYHQEIARSSFGDMLHDSDRNQKYYISLNIAIKRKHELGQKAHVLDIGTGTGLLAMMAASCGADSVVACECFAPIASIARDIIVINGFRDKIKVIGKRSTELKVGEDLEQRANILVTEVFDTELIGEGAIETFNHAKRFLLEDDSIIIPSIGWLYAVIVESSLLRDHNVFNKEIIGRQGLKIPIEKIKCYGSPGLHDIQVSQLPPESFKVLTKPVEVFRFNFYEGQVQSDNYSQSQLDVLTSGRPDCAIVWWELGMLGEEGPIISCTPSWSEQCRGIPAWRDHWMQAVFYLPHLSLSNIHPQLSPLILKYHHDKFSHWLGLKMDKDSTPDKDGPPVCTCTSHIMISRSRLGELNSQEFWDEYVPLLSSLINSDSVVLFIGDTSLLPLKIAQLGARKVYCCEEEKLEYNNLQRFIKENELEKTVVVLDEYRTDMLQNVNLVFSEPFFRNSLLPWDNLRCWYIKNKVLPQVNNFYPCIARVFAVPLQFDDLHKIRAPLGAVEGFKMNAFDELIKNSSEISDEKVEQHPLWEYPGIALSKEKQLFSFELNKPLPDKCASESGVIEFERFGICNGVALWMEWDFGKSMVTKRGPKSPIVPGQKVNWNFFFKQGVYLLPENMKNVTPGISSLEYNFTFEPTDADVAVHFSLS